MTILEDSDKQLYDVLTSPFDEYHKDQRYGTEITYITGEQAITRANTMLGLFGWSSEIIERWKDDDADEALVHVRVTVYRRLELLRDGDQIEMSQPTATETDDDEDDTPEGSAEDGANGVTDDDQPCMAGMEIEGSVDVIRPTLRREILHKSVHDSFGSAKIKRSRSTGKPINMGYVWKSAETDGVKRCLTRLGIGLHLYDKEELAAIEHARKTGYDRTEEDESPTPINQGRRNGAATGGNQQGGQSSGRQTGPFPLAAQGTGAFVTRCCALVEINGKQRQRCDRVIDPNETLIASDGGQYTGQSLINRTKDSTGGHVLCQDHARAWSAANSAKTA